MELSACDDRDATVDMAKKVATLLLTANKTDPPAKGVERSWGCVCNDSRDLPYAFRSIAEAKDDDFPLFPTSAG